MGGGATLPVREVLQQASPQLIHHHPSSSSAVRSARKIMQAQLSE